MKLKDAGSSVHKQKISLSLLLEVKGQGHINFDLELKGFLS